MTGYRTEDRNYGYDYFESLDNGAGYQDSVMWEDLAVAVKETFAISRKPPGDLSLSINHIDIGCAKGFLTRHLLRRGFNSRGVDFSQYAIDRAPEEYKDHYRVADITAAPVPNWSGAPYNLGTCFETMEHIPEPLVDVALENILKSVDGPVLFTICVEEHPDPFSDPTHITIKPSEWWANKFLHHGKILDYAKVEFIKRFWLFSQHNGVFVVNPAN